MIVARLSYAKRVEQETQRRWVTLDAKTGALIAVSSSGHWNDGAVKKVDEDTARKTAEAFLEAQQKERFAQCESYTDFSAFQRENGRYGTWSFQYARKEKGYFFANDQLSVGVDVTDGSVSAYSQPWTEQVKFDSDGGIISEEEAVSAYFKTF